MPPSRTENTHTMPANLKLTSKLFKKSELLRIREKFAQEAQYFIPLRIDNIQLLFMVDYKNRAGHHEGNPVLLSFLRVSDADGTIAPVAT